MDLMSDLLAKDNQDSATKDYRDKLRQAEKVDTRYGNFDFPPIPEYDGVQPSYLARKPPQPQPRGSIPKPGNRMV